MTTPSEETKIAVLATDVGYIKKGIDSIEKAFDEAKADYATKSEVTTLAAVIQTIQTNTITRSEFWPVRTIVYGGAGIILLAVFSMLVFVATGIKVNIK